MERLATYGTLAPGRANHHQLDGLAGRWFVGSVRGRLFASGWGADRVRVGVRTGAGVVDAWIYVLAVDGTA